MKYGQFLLSEAVVSYKISERGCVISCFPWERLGLLPSRLWSDTSISMYIILVHLPMSDEQRTLPDPGALNKEPLFHIDSSWVTLAEISGSPTFAECALPITLGFLTRLPVDTWEAASPGWERRSVFLTWATWLPMTWSLASQQGYPLCFSEISCYLMNLYI